VPRKKLLEDMARDCYEDSPTFWPELAPALAELVRRWRRHRLALFNSSRAGSYGILPKMKEFAPVLVACVLVASSVYAVVALSNALDRKAAGDNPVRQF